MSIISVAYLKEGIVLASDSRGTHYRPINGVRECRTEDRAPKTFLINSINVGISYCGNMRLEDELFHFAIKAFAEQNVTENDNAYSVAEKLYNKFKNNGTTFLVCGYIANEQHIYVVDDSLTRINKKGDKLYYGIEPFGKREAVLKLLHDKYDGVNCNELTLQRGIDISKELIECGIENEESCGGLVSILVVKDNGSEWKQRYFGSQDIQI